MNNKKTNSKTTRRTFVPDDVREKSETGSSPFVSRTYTKTTVVPPKQASASRTYTKTTIVSPKQASKDHKMPVVTKTITTTVPQSVEYNDEGRRYYATKESRKQPAAQKTAFTAMASSKRPSSEPPFMDDMVGRRGVTSGGAASSQRGVTHDAKNEWSMDATKAAARPTSTDHHKKPASNAASPPTSGSNKNITTSTGAKSRSNVGAVPVAGLDAKDDEDSMFDMDDTRTVETQAKTVVAQPVTDDELRDQFREELRGELQEEMEANVVHGEVMDVEAGYANRGMNAEDEGTPKFWTKRRLWIAGGVVLLVIIGIVVGVVFAVTGTESEPSEAGNCVTDTEALYANNLTLQSALNAYQADVEAQIADLSCTTSGTTLTCTINPTTTSSFVGFSDACLAAGGQGVTNNGRVTCSGSLDDGTSVTFILEFVGIYDCYADTCNEAGVAAEYQLTFQELARDLEVEFEAEYGTAWDCFA